MDDQSLPADLTVVTRASSNESLTIIDEFLRRRQHDAPLVIVDTLGKVKPPKASHEDSYQADYRIGGALKARVDDTPGACLLLVHHTRKAETADFIDAVSGTHGIAGSADFVLVLARKRHCDDAILAVTGRDVPESEYALVADEGRWILDGADLGQAAATAGNRREKQQLGDKSLEVLDYVNRHASPVRAADLIALGIDPEHGRVYLNRLAESGRIQKTGRGVYIPVTSVTTVTNGDQKQSDQAKVPTDTFGNPYQATVTSVTNDDQPDGNVTLVTNVTPSPHGFVTPTGPDRCTTCGWHTPTQGHRDTCPANN
jgi:hypothetical protein